ncbi:MAG: hypothetical protein ACI9U2_003991 [Bradymonadia bacterium]|jgi:hypothetical protein
MFEALGAFAELEAEGGPHLPRLLDALGQLATADVARVLDHLRAGVGVVDSMEMCVDPLDPGTSHPGGSGLLTDSRWVWRQDLAYYVERYKVGLPPAFIEIARAGAPVRFDGSRLRAAAAFGRAVREG